MPLKIAQKLEQEGNRFQKQGLFRQARVAFERAHQSYAQLHDPVGSCQVALRAADVSRQEEALSKARTWYGKAESHLKKIYPKSYQDQALFLDIETGRALLARAEMRYAEAARRFKFLLQRYRRSNDREGIAFSLWALGTTQRFQGKFQEAETNLQKSLVQYRSLSDLEGEAYALCGWGGTLRMRGEALRSRKAYQSANRYFQRTKDVFGQAYSACGIGNSFRMTGDLKTGLRFSQKAARLYERLGQKGPLAFVLWSLAQGEIALGEFKRAQIHLTRAETLFHAVQDQRGEVYAALGWGEFYRAKNSAKALGYYQHAQKKANALVLPFEENHARRGICLMKYNFQNRREIHADFKVIFRRYRRCGVRPSFQTYLTLP